jgi:hypothetical protein
MTVPAMSVTTAPVTTTTVAVPAGPAVPAIPASLTAAGTATSASATGPATTSTTSSSRWIRIPGRIGRGERESHQHVIRGGLCRTSYDQLSADWGTEPDCDRRPASSVGDRGIGVQLAIGNASVEAKHDRRSRDQAPAGIGRLDYQWRSQGTADRAALLVTRDCAQLGRQLISGKGDVTAAGAEEERNDEREGLTSRPGSETRGSHTSPC